MSDDNAHSLSLTGEREVGQYFEALLLPKGVSYFDLVLFPLLHDEPNALSKLHQSNLVRARSLQDSDSLIHHRGHIVAENEGCGQISQDALLPSLHFLLNPKSYALLHFRVM